MTAYYNEIDPYAAQWLRNLIKAGHIAPGEVDERSIVDVRPADLSGFEQCHFFAGIGVWSYAMRKAGWPDDRRAWTGSCPCQPFSAAGKGGGFDDERHLWPAFFYLIEQCRPDLVLGEQVASKDGLAWLDLVQTDMEGADYAFGAIDTCSAGFGAPHIRQRLRFAAYRLADALRSGAGDNTGEGVGAQAAPDGKDGDLPRQRLRPGVEGASNLVANADDTRSQGRSGVQERADQRPTRALGVDGDVADANGGDTSAEGLQRSGQHGQQPQDAGAGDGCGGPGPLNGFWRTADWLRCRDGKWRPVESGTFPLAHGAAGRVGQLRAYGNAVDAEATTEFIKVVSQELSAA